MINPFTHRKTLKKGMPGQATVIRMGVPARGAASFNLAMTLQVHVEGITPFEVEDQWMVKAKDAAALTARPLPVKVDPKDNQKVAIDREGVQEHQAQKAAGAAPATGFASDSAGGDSVAKLERLAKLRDSGPLTDKEFEREKKKILGES